MVHYAHTPVRRIVSHAADNLPSEQLDEVDDIDDDSIETYDVLEMMAVCRSDITPVMQLFSVRPTFMFYVCTL